MKSFWLNLSTLGPIGYLPAPGTCATLATLPLIFLLSYFQVSDQTYGFILAAAFVAGYSIIKKGLNALDRQDDPKQIVFDELVGTLVVFFALPFSLPTALLAVAIFRFLDITKTFGISSFELFFGAWGIMLDDIAAGVLTNLIVRIVIHYC